ncbi:alpha/beta fold hydrolase [Parvularcula marina]|uniref:Alpha/beta fold hydrolase n=1 Tax=Parvularcula marina TaxID=2292771 RepID=A0A371RIV6_9PROT|nr:alpha/beta fold hydrolase [Parvularcula marina]RFB05379.1 alpha/beta fold hydrolase [Parvularcula marina]
MSVFVLVHGAFHGRWCFRRLVSAIEARGHRAISIDLPGHGDDERDPATVTMADYVEAVSDTIKSVEHDNPFLVGHSMAGMVISQVAEAQANRLAGMAYIAAYLPQSGESLMAIEARNPAPRMATAVTPAPDLSHVLINQELAAPIFYNDCDDTDIRFCQDRLSTQPGAPFLTPVTLTEEQFGSVPKGYFLCEKDLTIPTVLQEEMVARRNDVDVYRLASGHSPFLSQVDALADGLVDYARDVLVKSGREAA